MKVKGYRYSGEDTPIGYHFVCPGCGNDHHVTIDNRGSGAAWGFNGDVDSPTFTPSLLARAGHYADGNTKECYCNWNERFPDAEPMPWKCYQCHSFVTDGKIQFLSDCSHALAGQTVELPDIEDEK